LHEITRGSSIQVLGHRWGRRPTWPSTYPPGPGEGGESAPERVAVIVVSIDVREVPNMRSRARMSVNCWIEVVSRYTEG
jgi:hypothetical protein